MPDMVVDQEHHDLGALREQQTQEEEDEDEEGAEEEDLSQAIHDVMYIPTGS